MTIIIRAAIVSLAFGGLVLAAPQAADAGTCKKLKATAVGLNKANVANRSKARLKRVINRWAWRHRVKVVKVGPKSTYCKKHPVRVRCTTSAVVCK